MRIEDATDVKIHLDVRINSGVRSNDRSDPSTSLRVTFLSPAELQKIANLPEGQMLIEGDLANQKNACTDVVFGAGVDLISGI